MISSVFRAAYPSLNFCAKYGRAILLGQLRYVEMVESKREYGGSGQWNDSDDKLVVSPSPPVALLIWKPLTLPKTGNILQFFSLFPVKRYWLDIKVLMTASGSMTSFHGEQCINEVDAI